MIDSKTIRVSDFQIVNGCQTVASIWSAWSDQVDIKRVRVLAKIVENSRTGSQADVVSSRIAERSNRQNVLRAEDWKSNDQRQERWRAGFDRLTEPWFYETKRGVWATQYKLVADKAPYRIGQSQQYRKVTLKDLGQSCYAFLGHPDGAQDRSREIFEREETYNLVFGEHLVPIQLLLPHLVYLETNSKVKQEPEFSLNGEPPMKTSHARFAIVATVSRMLRELAGIEQGYLSDSLAESLVGTRELWLTKMVDIAFRQVVRKLAQASNSQGVGPRAIVRRNNWWQDGAADAVNQMKDRIEMEKQNGSPEGSLAAALPSELS